MKKIDVSKIHPLARQNHPSVKITFEHTDGKIHTFCSCLNDLTGDRCTWFDKEPPTLTTTIKEVKSMIKKIYKNSNRVIEDYRNFDI
jgi:hypothetical protein